MIGLRYKTSDLNSINPGIFLTYNFGIELAPKYRNVSYANNGGVNLATSLNPLSFLYSIINQYSNPVVISFCNNIVLMFLENLTYHASFAQVFRNFFFSVTSFLYTTVYSFSSSVGSLLNQSINSLYSLSSIFNYSAKTIILDKIDYLLLSASNFALSLFENNLNLYHV
jgi:hypothetical protein